jgi:hypothetical protein
LLFLRARYYEPGTGRFIIKDPWPGTFQIPGTLHGFAYVLNNAPNGTDPTGLWCIFGLGDCDEDPDLAAIAYYYLLQTDFCVTIGDTWCWGGEDWGIDPWDPANNEMFYDDMYWTWYHPAQAWGLPEKDLRSRLMEDWFFEQGPKVEWYFDESHPATQALESHEGVRKYRQEFYRSGCRDIGDRNNPEDHGKWYEPGDNTPLDRFIGQSLT